MKPINLQWYLQYGDRFIENPQSGYKPGAYITFV